MGRPAIRFADQMLAGADAPHALFGEDLPAPGVTSLMVNSS
jgi:hypothetical protein